MYIIKYLLCLFLIYEVNCDCDTYLECFNNFFTSFFNDNTTDIAVNPENLPENFDHIQNVQVNELNRVLSQISSFISSDFNKQLNKTNMKFIDDGKTKIFIQDLNEDNINLEKLFLNTVEKDSNSNAKPKEKSNEIQKENIREHGNQLPVVTEIPQIIKRKKITYKDFKKDIKENEISKNYDSYYDSLDDNATDYPVIDYIDLYKDTTNEEQIYEATDPTNDDIGAEIKEKTIEYSLEIDDLDNFTSILPCHGNRTGIPQIYPWLATIFIKNDTTNNQFEYYCDGALLSDRAIVTAARCITTSNTTTVKTEEILVFLGKRSLQTMTESEKVVRINKILIHENFTTHEGAVENDLALLMIEEPVVYNDVIGPACFFDSEDPVEKSVTTAWTVQGDLTPVIFINKNTTCGNEKPKTICDSYGLDVPLCPSYGGIYASKRGNGYYLRGIRSADPSDRGLCFNKDLQYTSLEEYKEWIDENIGQ